MSSETLNSNSLRLCHILKWNDFDGYGFNLHAQKGKPGQYIGKVDEGSPADAAGLKEGDRIIEVNGVNIANENHKQVVQKIKALPDETRLLVVDAEGDNYFKAQNIIITSSLASVVTIKTPPDPSNDKSDDGDKSTKSASSESESQPTIINADTNRNSKSDHTNEERNGLNLNMTAKELRAQLAAKKKYDAKKDQSVDLKKKYDIVQKL